MFDRRIKPVGLRRMDIVEIYLEKFSRRYCFDCCYVISFKLLFPLLAFIGLILLHGKILEEWSHNISCIYSVLPNYKSRHLPTGSLLGWILTCLRYECKHSKLDGCIQSKISFKTTLISRENDLRTEVHVYVSKQVACNTDSTGQLLNPCPTLPVSEISCLDKPLFTFLGMVA